MKSIYDEVLDIVIESLDQPDNSVIFKHNGLIELKKALERAQKQEKLLEQYKKVTSAIVRISIKYPLYVIRESEGKIVEQSFNRIKELEK